jgi:TP901 family phage tail tape measure protein
MADNTSFLVSYKIQVDATQGVEQVNRFAESIRQLNSARQSFDPAVTNINNMMQRINRLFRDDKHKKKNFQYKFNIDTGKTEEKLAKTVSLLGEIKARAESLRNLRLHIDPGRAAVQKQPRVQAAAKNTAAGALADSQSLIDRQRAITRAAGKVNAALISLEKGRRVNIDTDKARQRLSELISLLAQARSRMNMGPWGMPVAGPAARLPKQGALMPVSGETQRKLYEKMYIQQQLHLQRLANRAQAAREDSFRKTALENARQKKKDEERALRRQDSDRRQASALAERRRKEEESLDRKRRRDEEKRQRRTAAESVRLVRSRAGMIRQDSYARQRGAINRLQYARAPSLRNMPMGHLFNAYMGYSLLRNNLSEAVEYTNIMETARSILRVADSDLTTFETRFGAMAGYVRRIGVETKFTAVEVAGAVKYLSMAGMGIGTIMHSIRPVADLALIGDNDISLIADLATNIMAGYNIKSGSMSNVADILASTVSRSNVSVIEMAESFKMAAGYMKTAGVDFTESSAAIGILGNMGVKGTMAGTTLRAMATRFAKPPKEARKVMEKLGVGFTYMEDVYGKPVEKLRPLADIFEDLNRKGASLEDMISIFGKIGGTGAMMFLNSYDRLRELSAQNTLSQGISGELAKVKQETAKGLWYQMTSMFSEGFMKGFEVLEPRIKAQLRELMGKFNTVEFSKGLASVGRALLDILSALGNTAAWFVRNFSWIEPLLFTGLAAARLFKLAGALTNVGVALGFIGKQSGASSALRLIGGLQGIGGIAGLMGAGKLGVADKRSLVTALRGAGVTGRGVMVNALAGAAPLAGRTGLFASQVTAGSGLVGAGASLTAISAKAALATGGISLLIGALGYAAYKSYQLSQAKKAVMEDVNTNTKYRYKSITDLYNQLHEAYKMAKSTRQAMDELVSDKTIEETSGVSAGAFTGRWWGVIANSLGAVSSFNTKNTAPVSGNTSFNAARQDDVDEALGVIARKDSQQRMNAAIAELAKLREDWEIDAFYNTIRNKYGADPKSLHNFGKDGSGKDRVFHKVWPSGRITYDSSILKEKAGVASGTKVYHDYMNNDLVGHIKTVADTYREAMKDTAGAGETLRKAGFDFKYLADNGFYRDRDGSWVQKALAKSAGKKDRRDRKEGFERAREEIKYVLIALREKFGNNSEIAENILKKAGIPKRLYTSEPDFADSNPWDANRITSDGPDDGGRGGDYSGTGKLSSAAPKQVNVHIASLLSVNTIDLMKSKEGQAQEIQDLKEQLAQALIDVVHDFDASWGS